MGRAHSPLLGYNTNVRHRGRVFHIQTEDSGLARPHVITHLFADGGRVVKSAKTTYAELVGAPDVSAQVKRLMQKQHKAMFVALREGRYDALIDGIGSASGSIVPPSLGDVGAGVGMEERAAGELDSLPPETRSKMEEELDALAADARVAAPGELDSQAPPAGEGEAEAVPTGPPVPSREPLEEERNTLLDLRAPVWVPAPLAVPPPRSFLPPAMTSGAPSGIVSVVPSRSASDAPPEAVSTAPSGIVSGVPPVLREVVPTTPPPFVPPRRTPMPEGRSDVLREVVPRTPPPFVSSRRTPPREMPALEAMRPPIAPTRPVGARTSAKATSWEGLFGDARVVEQSLDDVILAYLEEELARDGR